jgi:hypothetical protein
MMEMREVGSRRVCGIARKVIGRAVIVREIVGMAVIVRKELDGKNRVI